MTASVNQPRDLIQARVDTATGAGEGESSQTYCCLFFRFLLDRDSALDKLWDLSPGVSSTSSKGRFVPEVGVLAELVDASFGGGAGCGCVPGITSLGSDNIAR